MTEVDLDGLFDGGPYRAPARVNTPHVKVILDLRGGHQMSFVYKDTSLEEARRRLEGILCSREDVMVIPATREEGFLLFHPKDVVGCTCYLLHPVTPTKIPQPSTGEKR